MIDNLITIIFVRNRLVFRTAQLYYRSCTSHRNLLLAQEINPFSVFSIWVLLDIVCYGYEVTMTVMSQIAIDLLLY